ncbi:MAG: hypothetical protein OXE53_15140 [Deltaproteobacteria bacterium]|nr:hypothetical protein [Deltaproteobacteria bacterium]
MVAEIGRLLIEYPEKDWRELAGYLKDRALVENIATAIDDAIALTAKLPQKVKKERPKPSMSELARVAQEDKEKAETLTALKSRLADKDKTVTLAYIREFASSLGMKEELANRREQAVNQIIQYLATKTTEEIEAALNTMLPVQQSSGQEFDRWVHLILGGDASTRRKKDPGVYD